MIERRRSKRIGYRAEARIDGLDTSRTPTRVVDLSAEGAYIDSRMVLATGQRAVLSFTLVDRELSAEIEVIYALPGMGMGVQFINLSPAERALIKSLVAADASGSA